MRLWSIHPHQLDRAALVACWREALLAQAVIAGRTLLRFVALHVLHYVGAAVCLLLAALTLAELLR